MTRDEALIELCPKGTAFAHAHELWDLLISERIARREAEARAEKAEGLLAEATSELPFVSGSVSHRIRVFREDMERRLQAAEARVKEARNAALEQRERLITERIARREAEAKAEDYRIGQDTLRARVKELEEALAKETALSNALYEAGPSKKRGKPIAPPNVNLRENEEEPRP